MAKFLYKPINKMLIMFYYIGILSLLLEVAIFVHLLATGNIKLLDTSFDYILKAITCNFSGLADTKVSLLVIGASIFFYLGIVVSLGIFILSLVKKRYKALVGSTSSLIVAFIICLDLAVVSSYLFSDVMLSGVMSIIFFVISIVLIVMWVVSSVICVKYCLELRYNYETNFVFGEREPKSFLGNNYQEVDKEIVNVIKMNEDELEDNSFVTLPAKEQRAVVVQLPKEEVEEKPQEVEEVEVKQPKQEDETISEIQEDIDEELDKEIAHLQEETEEDEDDNLEDPEEDDEEVSVTVNQTKKPIKRLTFAQKLLKTNRETKQNYKTIRKYLESLGFRSKVTKTGNSFIYKNNKYVVIATSGKTGLRVYFKLKLEDYENSKIPLKDVSGVKKYEKTPVMLNVKSGLAVKRTKKLIDDIKSKLD